MNAHGKNTMRASDIPLVRGDKLPQEALRWLEEVERVFPGAIKDIIIVRSSEKRDEKTELCTRARAILWSGAVTPEDDAFLRELVKRHPQAATKIGIDHFEIRSDGRSQGRKEIPDSVNTARGEVGGV